MLVAKSPPQYLVFQTQKKKEKKKEKEKIFSCDVQVEKLTNAIY